MPVVVVLVALLVAGCGSDRPLVVEGKSTVESGVACVPASPVPAPLPRGFPELPAGAILTAVSADEVSGRVAGDVEDVVAHFRAAVDRAGYVITRDEDEGRSAQLAFFGTRGDGTATIAALTCPSGSTGFTLRLRTRSS